MGTPLASSPAPAWDAVTFLMSWRCRGMKQEGEEVRGPIEVAQAERKCVRGVQRPGETQKTGTSQGPRQRRRDPERQGSEDHEKSETLGIEAEPRL